MKLHVLLSLFVVSLMAPTSAVSQASNSSRATSRSASQLAQWTEADRKELLTKAQHGDTGAQFWVGAAYEQGWFGKADFQEALKWLLTAAKRGNPDAQNELGQMYENGEGVPQSYSHAAEWYRRAAEQVPHFGGASQGRNNLGILYMKGLGVPKNYVQAYMWFRLARTEANLSYARSQMYPAQISKAERMATEWKAHHSER